MQKKCDFDRKKLDMHSKIPYNPIMISLHHNGNTNQRIQIKGETNGCHYNLSDKLFNLITNLDAPELKNITTETLTL